jgi:hypothetical protein
MINMVKNVGSIDKIVRLFLALSRLYAQSWIGVIGLVPLFTGLINWCPIYSVIGVKTCPINN